MVHWSSGTSRRPGHPVSHISLRLTNTYTDTDASCRSNPYLSFDVYNLPRVKSPILQELFTSRKRDPIIAKAEDGGLFYINLPNNGNIGSFGYGAGNAMGTMDAITNAGGTVSTPRLMGSVLM